MRFCASILRNRSLELVAAALLCCCDISGCQQKMADQPSYRPLEYSSFFADGRAARPPVAGTVPSSEESDSAILTGLTNASDSAEKRPSLDDFNAEPPFPITMEVVERGQQRYMVFCAVCHGLNGEGDGTIVRRGYTRPPSYSNDDSRGLARQGIKVRLRDVPLGYFFEVATHGMGAMADYSTQVPPRDRWAIATYIRALQISQYAPLAELPPEEKRAAIDRLGGKP